MAHKKLKLKDILVKGAVVKAFKLDRNDSEIKRLIEMTEQAQKASLKLKDVSEEGLRMIVNI